MIVSFTGNKTTIEYFGKDEPDWLHNSRDILKRYNELLQNDAPMPHELVDGDCLRGDMRSLLEQLTPLQCRVLKMRYGIEVEEPMSLTGIGRELGMSRDRVRNLERDGLAGLRRLSEAVEAYVAA